MIDYKYMVRIYCRTYNHEKYIIDALNGFAEQQTNFPFVATIVEDHSKDNTANVIRQYVNDNFNIEDTAVAYQKETEYANVTYAQHKTNKNCFFAVILLKYNHHQLRKSVFPYIEEWSSKSKYFAICEGDDYWIDPLKLQKQVDYLESHQDVGLVHTDYHFVNVSSEVVNGGEMATHYKNDIKNGYIWHKYLLGAGYILTCTVLYRKSLVTEEKKFMDHGLFMMLERQMKVYQIPEVTACYRINPNGMMQSQISFVSKQATRTCFYQLYYYSTDREHTNKFYYRNLGVLFTIVRAIINNGRNLHSLEIQEAKALYCTIVRKNFLKLILLSPIVFIVIASEKLLRFIR